MASILELTGLGGILDSMGLGPIPQWDPDQDTDWYQMLARNPNDPKAKQMLANQEALQAPNPWLDPVNYVSGFIPLLGKGAMMGGQSMLNSLLAPCAEGG